MCHRKNKISSKFHYNALGAFCHLQKVTVSLRCFCKSVSAKIFHLQRNSWKGFWQVLASVKVKIIKLNWVKLARTNENTRFKQNKYYLHQTEQTREDDYNFYDILFYFLRSQLDTPTKQTTTIQTSHTQAHLCLVITFVQDRI